MKKPSDPPAREITPEALHADRRSFMRGALAVGGTALAAVAFRKLVLQPPRRRGNVAPGRPDLAAVRPKLTAPAGGAAEVSTKFEDIASYNNFYEFSTDKYEVAAAAADWKPATPWTVTVEGETHAPGTTYDLDALLRLSPPQERVYRMRCVEGWSMVIPWLGLPLGPLLTAFKPTANAKFVEFLSLADSREMPNISAGILDWPYNEGLRMDEAMHPLTLLATGIYGQGLPNQNGAPLRLVVPWKYGFKGAKSITTIRFRDSQPTTTWMKAGPDEYGFYSNVNPTVDHPRWSQARERRIGESDKRKTLMFNGYADEVAALYTGMDLKRNF
ncbi:MAG: protein-methionine-sulfoxide reductase catalytic subunit MsrP [Deltaproteobacteria bacterium]|nr:protein-methionine-sulfoxide reductase catalytic subunit MsrP [Deltaproteobacteria bacterium]